MIFIDTHSTDVFYNFGCEYYFASEKDLGDDVFMLWNTSPTLMIGKYQNTLEEINGEYAKEHGITVVRRMSGGGTIYTDPGGWQFTFITRRTEPGMIEFARFVNPIVDALRSLGADVEPTGRNDITLCGKKISGNAQYKLKGSTVHHGSLLFDTDIDELVRSTTPKEYKITSKSIKSVRDRVTNIREHLSSDMDGGEFRRRLISSMTDSEYIITPEDERHIIAFAAEKFADPAIIYAAAPAFEAEKTLHLPGGNLVIGFTVKNGRIESAGISGDFFGVDDADTISRALRGCPFTPEDVRSALRPLSFYAITPEEIANGLFS